MKRIALLLLTAAMLLSLVSAQAEGLLPGSQEVFGAFMPDMSFSIGRNAVKDEQTEKGRVLVFSPFADADYAAFGDYVNGWGCTAGAYTSDEGSITIEIVKQEAKIIFTYDRANGSASVTYPAGTRPEKEKREISAGMSKFPSVRKVFGVRMPSLSEVTGTEAYIIRNGSEVNQDTGLKLNITDDSIIVNYSSVGEDQFDAFSARAAQMGCVLSEYTRDTVDPAYVDYYGSEADSFVIVRYTKENAELQLLYDDATGGTVVIYSAGAYFNDEIAVRTDTAGALITAEEIFGAYMPNVSSVLDRAPDSVEKDAEGNTVYLFSGFYDGDYNTFGSYMGEKGCAVAGYTTEGSALIIRMEKDGHTFTFIYERDTHTGKVIYPEGTRAERWNGSGR